MPSSFTVESNVYEFAERFGVDPDTCWDKPYIDIITANADKASKVKQEMDNIKK